MHWLVWQHRQHSLCSDVPIKEVISEVRVARVEGEYIVNPSRTQLGKADMDFIIGATEKNLMMVEGEAKECSEEELVKALGVAHEAIKIQIQGTARTAALKKA